MLIRTPADLGAIIRERRLKLGLDQLSLAKKAGTSRKWVVEIENGKPRAQIGLVLRTLKALGIELTVNPAPATAHRRPATKGGDPRRGESPTNIDSILDSLKKQP